MAQTGRWHVKELNREKRFMYLIPTSWEKDFFLSCCCISYYSSRVIA